MSKSVREPDDLHHHKATGQVKVVDRWCLEVPEVHKLAEVACVAYCWKVGEWYEGDDRRSSDEASSRVTWDRVASYSTIFLLWWLLIDALEELG